MCAGCPGGRTVSKATAYINLHGLKPAVLAEFRRRVGRRATVTVLGDRWVLRSRTGAQHVLSDVEALAGALVERKLVDRALPADHGWAALDMLFERGRADNASPVPADQLVSALLAGTRTG